MHQQQQQQQSLNLGNLFEQRNNTATVTNPTQSAFVYYLQQKWIAINLI